MSTTKCDLNLHLTSAGTRTNPKTLVLVKFGPLAVASALLNGKYTPPQAMKELKQRPWKFSVENQAGRDILRSLGIAA